MKKQVWKPGAMLNPVPPVMVSCGTMQQPNIITIGWTGIVNTSPAMTYISVRPTRHSYQLIKESGEFVINLTTKSMVFACDYCGVKSGRDINKFETMNLTPQQASSLQAPMIAQSPINLECKVKQITELGTHHMFLAEIVAVNVDEQMIDKNGRLMIENCDLIAYAHGKYFELGDCLGSFGYSVKKKKKSKNSSFNKKGK